MSKITMIKKDAIIDIKIGSGFLKKLQQLIMYVSANISEEDINKYSEELKNVKDADYEFSEPWMDALTTISFLLKSIEEGATQQGHTYEADIDDVIKESDTTEEEN